MLHPVLENPFLDSEHHIFGELTFAELDKFKLYATVHITSPAIVGTPD